MGMGLVVTSSKEDFYQQIQQVIYAEADEGKAVQLFQFVQAFFDKFPLAELANRDIQDVFGMMSNCFDELSHFTRESPKIRAYNPTLRRDGWKSDNTVIIVIHRDIPFLVDSIRLALINYGVEIHTLKSSVITTKRDEQGTLQALHLSSSVSGAADDQSLIADNEAVMYFEITRQIQQHDAYADIIQLIEDVLADVRLVIKDYKTILARLNLITDGLIHATKIDKLAHIEEYRSFIDWLKRNSFIFFGYAYYTVDLKLGSSQLEEALGLLSDSENISNFIPDINHNKGVLTFSKSFIRSRVHRHAYPDHIVIRHYNENGKVCGEHHLLGLYTARVYRDSTDSIPIVRQKVAEVFNKSRLSPNSYEGKVLQQVFETFPRDELFQSNTDELYATTTSIAHINERHQVRLFMRKDPNGYFVSTLVYIPRDIYSSEMRLQVTNLISEIVGAQSVEFYTHFSESILVRTYMIFKLEPDAHKTWDINELQQQVIELTRSWRDNLFDALKKFHGVRKGREIFKNYQQAFSSSYRENFDVDTAVEDIELIREVSPDNPLAMHFVESNSDEESILHFKIFHWGKVLRLSDVIPVLEYMGLTVVGEHPYKIRKDNNTVWMHDFSLESRSRRNIDVSQSRGLFEQSFIKIWQGYAESDDFNGLTLAAQLHWREITLLRAYAVYMKQTVFPFSHSAIANALINYPDITKNLVALFHSLFDPDLQTENSQKQVDKLIENISLQLDEVENLNDDRIINRYLDLIKGTLRTNYYQKIKGNEKSYMSFKFSPKKIADIPEPRPLYEIFVYSPMVEGVHLRGGKVARGGLRWSDRSEDYRTEVLGLVKAQQVKNSVIVPSGAKGGFVAKKASIDQGRDTFMKEGIACYKIFIKGLLDITDNLRMGKIVSPSEVVRLDDDDPYLVVAADKGTATFSDIANEIALEYDYWMGDAFASGGSQGYDHKKMGITAKGAWVSVQRHFREKGINIQQEDFTVIGIGDMSGDVFGNGMLLSEHIRLVAAFNHLHIFVDPDPDPTQSFIERKRLFESPQLSWNDYDKKIISQGGGVFSRQAKSIVITQEMRARFDIKGSRMTPNELINALLKSPVDLIWNGGIGTYVKSSQETHADVGDKANDSLRVNGDELRCQVFGEGGNLGLTQLGRIEYCLNGGACNTDFIDNAAGVDCSDHEVNIKILLNDIMSQGELTETQRNRLLANMTDDVANMVLNNNYRQTQAISVAQMEVTSRIGEYRRLINSLEDAGRLNRALEYIPSDDEIVERIAKGKTLTRPELSVLTSYVKVMLKEELAVDSIAGNAYLAQSVEKEFPKRLQKKYKNSIDKHILRKEIVATQIANDMVNTMGITFCSRLMETTGDDIPAIATAYVVARDIFQLDDFRKQIDALDYQIPAEEQMKLLFNVMRRVRRGTRWFLRNRRHDLDPSVEIDFFKSTVRSVINLMPTVIDEEQQQQWQQDYNYYCSLGFKKDIANAIVMPIRLFSGLGIAEAVKISNVSIKRALILHHMLGEQLGVYWFAHSVSGVAVKSLWQAIARETFIDDLDGQLRRLCVAILRLAGAHRDLQRIYSLWERQHKSLLGRWNLILHGLKTAKEIDYSMFSVAIRELNELTKATENCRSLADDSVACELGD